MPHTIHTHSETRRQSAPAASKARSCGCTPLQETCCQLDCLTQPNFFSGQLLTDTDLNQLLTWSKDKFRLSRFRHGWGVVCGLEVQCDSGSQSLRVAPGYAMDCCGHDILVCEDTTISLDEACATTPDPCAAPAKRSMGNKTGKVETINFFGSLIPENEVHQKILTLRYQEVSSDFETALGYAASDGTADCQPSRMREGFTLGWVDALDQPVTDGESWNKQFNDCREVLQKYWAWAESRQADWSKQPDKKWRNIRAWLLRWIDGTSGVDAHPLHQFCWLRDYLCSPDKMNPDLLDQLDQHVTSILFWLVQDCRNHILQTGCRDCQEDDGVPLARVCLWARGRQDCKVLSIDPYPPYRRPLSLDSWPVKPGQVNISQAIWQSPGQARALLTAMGLTVELGDTPFHDDTDPRTLYDDLKGELFVERDQKISLQVVDAKGCLGLRVVGVRSAPSAGNGSGAVEQALSRVLSAAKASQDLAKKLHDRGPYEKWEGDALKLADGAAKAARAVEEVAKKLREYGPHDKWEAETLVLAETAARTTHGVEDLAKQLYEHGSHDTWEAETLLLADEAAKAARAVDELAKKLRERATGAARASG